MDGSGSATREYTVTDLTNGREYRFQVRAVAGSVAGAAGPSTGATPSVLVGWAFNGAVELRWVDPEDARIARWQYQVRRDRGSWGSWQSISGSTGSTTSHLVRNLSNGASYRFKVRGVTSSNGVAVTWSVAGVRPSSSLADPPAQVREPDAPRNLTATAGDEEVALAWETPAANGSAITGYEYRQSTDGGTNWSVDWTALAGSGASTTKDTVESLTNGTAYTFEVRAVNGVGEGPESNQASATPQDPPVAPTKSVAPSRSRVGDLIRLPSCRCRDCIGTGAGSSL